MNNNDFNQYDLQPHMLRSLAQMGFRTTTPVQHQTLPPFLAGEDLIVQAPTGTGKTAAFGIPLVQMTAFQGPNPQGLILCPTRELALQITRVLRDLTQHCRGIRVAALYGGENISRQFALLRRNPHIIVATPGRLLDHMQRRTVALHTVKTVVLDEADRMLDMGFRQDLDRILQAIPTDRQTVLFSATMSRDILAIANRYQQDARRITVKQETLTVTSVRQFYTRVNMGEKGPSLTSLLKNGGFESLLVFVNTKRMADKLCRQLVQQGFRAGALHGDMPQPRRDRVMQAYRQGEIAILVATDVAARGIDVHHIDAVVNYDLPKDSESYVHRIGRTGRAGQRGVAHSFIYPQEMKMLRTLMQDTRATIDPYRPAAAPAV